MIAQGQRVLSVGMTGEGKSQLLAHLFSVHSGQRLLIDVQDHYHLGPDAEEEGGALEASRPSEIDWRIRTIRYVPQVGSPREFDELYRLIYSQGRLLVWCDEAEDVAPVQRTPRWVRKVVKQGRKRGITHLAATQRPHGVERSIINQSEHCFLFRMVDPDDLRTLSYRVGIPARELAEDLGQLPKHGFLYHELGQPPVERPPLPPALIEEARRHVVIPS